MTDPIEAVAERLWEVVESQCVPHEPSRVPWSKAQDRDRQEVREQARAAIAAFLDAVREPSEAMVRAAIARPGPDDIHELLYFGVFRAMVDALAQEVAGDE